MYFQSFVQSAMQTPLRWLPFGNGSLWMGRTIFFLTSLISNLRLCIKDSKWGIECIFMNCASCNGSPQQIPLRQFPFANEAKPRYCCRAFWAASLFNHTSSFYYVYSSRCLISVLIQLAFAFFKKFIAASYKLLVMTYFFSDL